MDELSFIRQPVAQDLENYKTMFDETLTHEDDFLGRALSYLKGRKGKMMRPLLVLLVAKELGVVKECTLRSAVTLELLHTASLVHDDVVDESDERRGQASANSVYGNKIAVLLGDYLLSKALHQAALTGSLDCVEIIAKLGATLSEGEVFQLANIRNEAITEAAYFRIIQNKTAELFATCAELGALSAGADAAFVSNARELGNLLGICFQIRDDIFDYYEDSKIGKPTGNDMAEGKMTLPVIYALQHCDDPAMHQLAAKIKRGDASPEEIRQMVNFAKEAGGITYAVEVMEAYHQKAMAHLSAFKNEAVRNALQAYLDFVIGRKI